MGNIFVHSFILLASETLLIKFFRYQYSSLSLLVISFTLLGMACSPFLKKIYDKYNLQFKFSTLLFAALSFMAISNIDLELFKKEMDLFRILYTSSFSFIFFLLLSYPIVNILQNKTKINQNYALSLFGSFLGVVVTYSSLYLFGDQVSTYLIYGLIALNMIERRKKITYISIFLIPVFCFSIYYIDLFSYKNPVVSASDNLTRIDAYQHDDIHFEIKTNGINAGYSTLKFIPERYEPYLKHRFVQRTPFVFQPKDILILGAGGGRNVNEAKLDSPNSKIDAVEILPLVKTVNEQLLDDAENIYKKENVQLIIEEGRSFTKKKCRENKKYDLVYVPMVSLIGSSPNIFALSYLLTKEAINDYACITSQTGQIGFLYVNQPIIFGKVLNLARSYFPDKETFYEHTLILRTKYTFVVLVSPHVPFSQEDKDLFKNHLQSKGLVDYYPENIMEHESLGVLTDDNPFFFNIETNMKNARKVFHFRIEHISYYLYFFFFILILSFFVKFNAKTSKSNLYFILIGFSYNLVQIYLIQRLGLSLGDPFTSSTVVIGLSLIATGVGSYYSGFIFSKKIFLILSFFSGLALSYFANELFSFFTLGGVFNYLIAAVLIFLIFVPTGIMFPTGVRFFESKNINSFWYFNGLASVLGGIFGIYNAMLNGFSSSIIYIILGYAVAFLILFRSRTTH